MRYGSRRTMTNALAMVAGLVLAGAAAAQSGTRMRSESVHNGHRVSVHTTGTVRFHDEGGPTWSPGRAWYRGGWSREPEAGWSTAPRTAGAAQLFRDEPRGRRTARRGGSPARCCVRSARAGERAGSPARSPRGGTAPCSTNPAIGSDGAIRATTRPPPAPAARRETARVLRYAGTAWQHGDKHARCGDEGAAVIAPTRGGAVRSRALIVSYGTIAPSDLALARDPLDDDAARDASSARPADRSYGDKARC